MSWRLKRSSGEEYFLLPTCDCKVGRQGCQIIISDPTVSRHHADLRVSRDHSGQSNDMNLTLRDVSKFVQTTVNGSLLSNSDRERSLRGGDKLSFGASSDVFTVVSDPLVLMVDPRDLGDIQFEVVSAAGAYIRTEWECRSAGMLVNGNPCHSSPMVLRAMCENISLLTSGYIEALKNTQSGTTSLPRLEDHLLQYPRRSVARSNLFAGFRFVLCEDVTCPDLAQLISSAGGEVVKDWNRPLGDLFIISDSLSQPRFRFRIERSRLLGSPQLLRALWEGMSDELTQAPVEDYGPAISDGLANAIRGSGWISTKTITPNRLAENVTPSTSNSTTAGLPESVHGKKFKKARIRSENHTVVPLEEWANTTLVRKNVTGDLRLKNTSDGIDEWLNSYNSQ